MRSEVRLIRGSPNGVHHARPQPCRTGRHRPERVVVIDWKCWSPSTGNTGRHAPERATHDKYYIKPNKMMLGPCRGGVVRLGLTTTPLLIGEGLETCLAAMQATRLSAWAALSTSGMAVLDLPRDIPDVIILADGDAPGDRAATTAARRWACAGRRVRIARPPTGKDFNDVLLGLE